MSSYAHGRASGGGMHDRAVGRSSAGTAPGKRTLVEGLPGGGAIQRKAGAAAGTQAGPVPSGGGQGRELPAAVRTKMESAFNADFSAVRVHEGPQASAVGALAFTQGTEIHFAPGQYDPDSQRGQELLGHELAHVVQQAQGRVVATAQAKDGEGTQAVNDDASLESEADALGARAAQGLGAAGATGERVQAAAGTAPIQCYRDYEAAESSQRGGGGLDYKLLQKADYHIKLHPIGGKFENQVWNELHVTFELFKDDDTKCPKIYFDDQGKRLAGHDNDRVNREYKQLYAEKDGRPSFESLIQDAEGYAGAYLDGAPEYLDEQHAMELVTSRREKREQLEKRRQEEHELLKDERGQRDEVQSKSFGTAYTTERGKQQLSLFGGQSAPDDKDEVLKLAGLDGHKLKVLIKRSLWNLPKEEWVKSQCGDAFDKVQEARLKLEQAKQPTETVVEQSHTPEKISEVIKEEGISQDQARELGTKLAQLGESEKKDPGKLVSLGLPQALAVLVISVGVFALLRVLGVL